MHRTRWGGMCLAVVLSLGIVACSGSPRTATPTPTSLPPTSPPTTVTAESTPTPTLAPTPTPAAAPAPTASALGDLAAFIDAAREVDTRLHAATPLINASIQTDAVMVDERTATAVTAIDFSAVASAIPAGMPADLMRQVLTVYSDLVSRTLAVSGFRFADRTYSRIPSEAVVTTAGSTPPLPALDPTSLAYPELEARLQEIVGRNGGCGACGGHVATRSSSIVWDPAAPSATTRNGTIVHAPDETGIDEDWGVSFTAVYAPGEGWTVEIHAC
jgi:hypothetical protein